MSKALTFSTFILAGMAVMAVFLTATTYNQLAIAVVLYPILIYFAFKAFPRKTQIVDSSETLAVELPKTTRKEEVEVVEEKVERTEDESSTISDINKRAFLKLVGATGLSFFLISVFGRRMESLFFGKSLMQTPTTNSTTEPSISPSGSPTDGYNISEIADGAISYYGFINQNGGWFIMRGDSSNGSYRYNKGNRDFPSNWKKRTALEYDYFYKVFN